MAALRQAAPPPVEEPDSLDTDLFGLDVALSGDWALVSSHDDERCINNTTLPRPNFCDAGAVFAYQRQDNDHWELQQKIAPEELGDRDFFGRAIAMEGSRAVFAAFGDDDACPDPPPPTPLFCNPGAVYLFELIDDEWQQVDKFTASDADSSDILGLAVAISGSHVIAGAPRSTFDSNPKPDLGAAYLFKIFNRDPVAQDDQATTSQNTPVEIDVLANDSDPDFDKITLKANLIAGPSNGTVTVSDTAISYTPDDGFAGIDALTYEIDDGDGGTAQANVTINVASVNAAPSWRRPSTRPRWSSAETILRAISRRSSPIRTATR